MISAKLQTQFKRFQSWRWRDRILLALLVLAVACANILWIFTETRPPHWDMARHLWTSLNYFNIAKEGRLQLLAQAYFYYPPLLYWLVLPWYFLFGPTVQSAVTANIVFIAILAGSVYGIVRRLATPRIALTMAALCLATPMLASQFKEFQIDAPLTAIVTLTLYLIIANAEFIRLRYSAALGFVIGLGLLTKWTFGFIIAVPLIATICISVWKSWREHSARRLINMAFAGLVAYAVLSPWYVYNFVQLRIDLFSNGVDAGVREGDPVVGSLISNIWYFVNMLSRQLYLIPFLLVLAGLITILRSRAQLRRYLYPLLLVIGTLAFFTLLRNKDARYTLPMIPAALCIGAAWLSQLNHRRQIFLLGFLSLYAGLSFCLISFGSEKVRTDISYLVGGQPITLFSPNGYIIGPPTQEDWGLEDAFRRASELPADKRTLAYSGPDSIWFNNWDLSYYTLKYGVPIIAQDKASFVLTRQWPTAPDSAVNNATLIWSKQFPDGTIGKLYQVADRE